MYIHIYLRRAEVTIQFFQGLHICENVLCNITFMRTYKADVHLQIQRGLTQQLIKPDTASTSNF